MKIRSPRLLAFEVGQVFWIAVAGSGLHFAFELSDYWRPLALFAAVNESAWEHTKMYFWPGLLYALVQYTYTRDVARNYWFGKAMALALTPAVIFTAYFAYLSWATADGGKPTLAIMLSIMVIGIAAGQAASYYILTAPPLGAATRRYALVTYAILVALFSSLTFFPPRLSVWENFYCYQYTGEYGILDDYTGYRVFYRPGAAGAAGQAGGGVNYCKALLDRQARSGVM
jgi:hypothetical protein